jgi:hypothetical protein
VYFPAHRANKQESKGRSWYSKSSHAQPFNNDMLLFVHSLRQLALRPIKNSSAAAQCPHCWLLAQPMLVFPCVHVCSLLTAYTARRHKILIGCEAGQVEQSIGRWRARRQLLLLLLAACKYCQSREERERQARRDLHVERALSLSGRQIQGPNEKKLSQKALRYCSTRLSPPAPLTHSLSL